MSRFKQHILRISRYNPIWSRAMKIVAPSGISFVEKPLNTIICDGCNSLITTENINCLVLSQGYIHSAQCETCRIEYFKDFPILKGLDYIE